MKNQENSDVFQQMLGIWQSPELQAALRSIEQVTAYQLSQTARRPFLKFHSCITTDPPPDYIVRWRAEPKLEHWYHRHVNGILGDTQNALACVYYHQEQMLDLESRVLAELSKHNYMSLLGATVVGVPNTQKWDFEYQAFVLAVRRCLDYLARALAAFFQNDFNSFRRLPRVLRSVKPSSVAEQLIRVHAIYVQRFSYVLSEGDRKSTRDRLSHYEYVPVGVINLSSKGFMLLGGCENLTLTEPDKQVRLSTIIQQRVTDLQECIDTLLNTFVASVATYYASPDA